MREEGSPNGILALLAILAYGTLCLLQGGFWDDQVWLQAVYASDSLGGFLEAGLSDLRRPTQGAVLYGLLSLHRLVPSLAPLVWHGLTLLLLLASALLLFRLLRRSFELPPGGALLCAVLFLVMRPDTTFPIVSNTIYRGGVLIGLVSLALTERSVRSDRFDRSAYVGALLTGGVGAYVFMEGVLFYEPARAWLTVRLLRQRRGCSWKEAFLGGVKSTVPFAVLALPLVVMKLTLKPTGIYAGQYEVGRLQDGELGDGLLYLIDHPVRALAEAAAVASAWAPFLLVLGLAGGLVGAAAAKRISAGGVRAPGRLARRASLLGVFGVLSVLALSAVVHSRVGAALGLAALGGTSWRTAAWLLALCGAVGWIAWDTSRADTWSGVLASWRERSERDFELLLFAGLMLVVPFALYLVFGRVLGPGVNSRHAGVLQIGYATLAGLVFVRVLAAIRQRGLRLCLAGAVVGLGVGAVNATTVAYDAAARERGAFVRSVAARLPIPPSAGLFVDAPAHLQAGGRAWTAPLDLDTNADVELPLNLLYARSTRPEEFLVVRVITADLWDRGLGRPEPLASHETHFGRFEADLGRLTFLRWRHGRLLINEEIVQDDPAVRYRRWADKPVPPALWSRVRHPYRDRAPGLD